MAKLVTRTQYIENTEDILDFAVTKLQEYDGWKVRKFPGRLSLHIAVEFGYADSTKNSVP